MLRALKNIRHKNVAVTAKIGDIISVILPNYNHGKYLKDNIKGLQAQSYPHWNLHIVDDGSSDTSVEIIKTFAAKDPRIQPIFFTQNKGVMAAANAAMAAASGFWLYGSAADDFISNPAFFEMAIAALTKTPAAGFFGTTSVVDAESMQEEWVMGSAPHEGYIAPAAALEAFLHSKIFVPGTSAIWRRDLIEACGGYDAALGPQSDYYINHALPALKGVVFSKTVMATYRADQKSYSASVPDDDFFRRHALVEKKLKNLAVDYFYDPRSFQDWRNNIINARLGVNRQKAFIDFTRQNLRSIEPWERNSLNPLFLKALDDVNEALLPVEQKLTDHIATAHCLFEEYAGVNTVQASPPHRLLPTYLRKVRDRLRRYAGAVLP